MPRKPNRRRVSGRGSTFPIGSGLRYPGFVFKLNMYLGNPEIARLDGVDIEWVKRKWKEVEAREAFWREKALEKRNLENAA